MYVYLCEHVQIKVECLAQLSSSLIVEARSVAEPRALESQLSLATQPAALGSPVSGPLVLGSQITTEPVWLLCVE